MRRIVFRLALAFVMLLSFALPSQAVQSMSNMSINFGPPGCTGDVTIKIQVPGAPLTATAHIDTQTVPPDTALTKALKVAQAICNNPACGAPAATCSALTTVPPSIFACPASSFSIVLSGASVSVNGVSLNAVLCKESTCETETMIASSPANMNILSAARLTSTVTEGNLVITVNEGPPVRSVSIATAGKPEWQIMTEAAAALNALGLGINAATATICNRLALPSMITSFGVELYPLRTAVTVLNTAGNANLSEFKFTPPGAGWAVTYEGSPELAPSTTGTPALTTWGISAFVGLVLLAGAWMLRRGLAH